MMEDANYFVFKAEEGNLTFEKIEPILFELDLILIESSLPQILAAMLIKAYKDGVCKFSELLHWLEFSNPLRFDQSFGHKFYEYKVKKFLMTLVQGRSPYDYKSQPNYLLENTELILSNVTFTPFNGDLYITIGIKIG